ncbi:MAG: 4a-hydroxytetrahydrobiopterin dehydratase [Chloroflexi bacterium]|nr:MAG: 4a-hydroxytetrahydrobiopterin dehydratase [Chloroflexota bacterium]
MSTPALNEAEILERLESLDGWQRQGDTITKTFKTKTYLDGIALASAIGVIAEGFDHHPDMYIGWRKVTVTFTTHDAGNKLSHKDFDAAAAIDALPFPTE